MCAGVYECVCVFEKRNSFNKKFIYNRVTIIVEHLEIEMNRIND
jgi:hypothetical protein